MRVRAFLPLLVVGACALPAGQAAAATIPLVSLGDSYSSGEGAGPFDDGTAKRGNRCDRSANAWPRKLGVPKAFHFACSGATTGDFYEGQEKKAPDNVGQLDRLKAAAKTNVIGRVLVGIGGNDLGFASIMKHCVTGNCLRDEDNVEIRKANDVVRPAIAGALRDVSTFSGGAQVILVGYPDIFPGRGKSFHRCGWMTDKEKPRVWKLEAALDEAMRAAADDAGAIYISTRKALAGHELCTSDSWIKKVGSLKFWSKKQGHPNPGGQTAVAKVVQAALIPLKPPVTTTTVTRQIPVTGQAAISPGFTVAETYDSGKCIDGSEVGQAYRCFTDHYVLDPCYAIAEPGTGDGTGVVCPMGPFSTELRAITTATGLGKLDPVTFDAFDGIVLANGASCVLAQGAHSTATNDQVIDYYCDDDKTVVLRDLHQRGVLWTADVARGGAPKYTYVPSGVQRIASAVLLQRDVPPANRPVTDAGNATIDELDSSSRVHHEVDCGAEQSTRYSSPVEQMYASGIDCVMTSLIVTEWDTNNDLEAGWSCAYSDNYTLLCQNADSVNTTNAPAFFTSTHIRALTVG